MSLFGLPQGKSPGPHVKDASRQTNNLRAGDSYITKESHKIYTPRNQNLGKELGLRNSEDFDKALLNFSVRRGGSIGGTWLGSLQTPTQVRRLFTVLLHSEQP